MLAEVAGDVSVINSLFLELHSYKATSFRQNWPIVSFRIVMRWDNGY